MNPHAIIYLRARPHADVSLTIYRNNIRKRGFKMQFVATYILTTWYENGYVFVNKIIHYIELGYLPTNFIFIKVIPRIAWRRTRIQYRCFCSILKWLAVSHPISFCIILKRISYIRLQQIHGVFFPFEKEIIVFIYQRSPSMYIVVETY